MEGLDGVKKMSKSYDNTIGVNILRMICLERSSISDELMWRYFELLSNFSPEDIQAFKDEAQMVRSRDKLTLASDIVSQYRVEGGQAQERFLARFQKKQIPDDRPIKHLTAEEAQQPLVTLLKQEGMIASTSEGLRLIKQGAIKIDGHRVNENLCLDAKATIVTVGKRRIIEFKITD